MRPSHRRHRQPRPQRLNNFVQHVMFFVGKDARGLGEARLFVGRFRRRSIVKGSSFA